MANTVDILGDDAVMDSIIDRSITEIVDSNVTKVGGYAFYKCSLLATADFPNATSIERYAFSKCTALTIANFPNVTSIGASGEDSSTFDGCTALTTANFPLLTMISSYSFLDNTNLKTVNFPKVSEIRSLAFRNCTSLSSLDLPSATKLSDRCFTGCTALETLILRNTIQVCTLGSISVFTNTPIESGTGYIYVPSALVDSYKTANNWSTYAAQIRAIEDYTVDGTTTGALDESKI